MTQGFTSAHQALDFGYGNGRTVYAAAAGLLTVDKTPGYGLRASVAHGALITPSTITRYAHLSSVSVPSGSWVARGQQIGVMGDSGSFAKGTHLHFELLLNFTRKNPLTYLSGLDPAGSTTTPIGDTLSAAEVDQINKHIDSVGSAVFNELAMKMDRDNVLLFTKIDEVGSTVINLLMQHMDADREKIIAAKGGTSAAPAYTLEQIADAVNDEAARRLAS